MKWRDSIHKDLNMLEVNRSLLKEFRRSVKSISERQGSISQELKSTWKKFRDVENHDSREAQQLML